METALINNTRVFPKEMIAGYKNPQQAVSFFRRAIAETNDQNEQGGSISAWLERQFPIDQYPERKLPNGTALSGLEFTLMGLGIKTRSIPDRGIWSSHIREFLDSENATVNYALFQEYVAVQQTVIAPLGPNFLANVVGLQVPFTGTGFQVPVFNPSQSDRQMFRIAEGSEIPLVTMPFNTKAIRPFVYGKGLEASYNALRRSTFTVEAFGLEVQLVEMQSQLDRAHAAVDVAINGDTQYGGSTGAATSVNLTTLDPATTAGNFTAKAYNAMMTRGHTNNGWYDWDVVVGNEASLAILLNMTGLPNGFSPFVNLPAGPNSPQNVAFVREAGAFSPLHMIPMSTVPANTVVLMSSRWGIIEGVEQGGKIQERERVMSNQMERIYMTESIATGVWHPGAILVVNLGA